MGESEVRSDESSSSTALRGRDVGWIGGMRDFLVGSAGGSRIVMVLVCVGWGSTFSINKLAFAHLGVFAYLGLRFLVGWVIVASYTYVRHGRERFLDVLLPSRLSLWLGLVLFVAYATQSLGLLSIAPATSGFITGSFVVMVPLFGALFAQRPTRAQFLAACVAFVGLGLLSLPVKSGAAVGEALTLLCAISVGTQIVFTERNIARIDPIRHTMGQFLVISLSSFVISFIHDTRSFRESYALHTLVRPEILFATVGFGILTTGVAYLAQVNAQRHLGSTELAVILNTEPLFAALFGFIILGDTLGPVPILGGVLVLGAVVVTALRG